MTLKLAGIALKRSQNAKETQVQWKPDLTINILCPGKSYSKLYGAESRFNSIRFNNITDLTINILCPGKSYSKLYGAESRFVNIRFSDIPGITMEI